MGSIDDISQLCRLCLVKDQVNIPIFNETSDIEQIFVKINSCLPVKVSRDDNLPKKICDGCSYKLDMLYIFRNTSLDSEKQLIQWLDEAGLNSAPSEQTEVDPLANPLTSTKPEIMVKQETIEPSESRGEGDNSEICMDAQNYIIQQQKLPYEQDFDFGEPSGSSAGLMTDEPAPKRAKRTAAIKKAPLETVEDDLDAAMQITKAEEEDSDEVDQPDYVEPSTSADDQPGPSGVGKPAVEAPCLRYLLIVPTTGTGDANKKFLLVPTIQPTGNQALIVPTTNPSDCEVLNKNAVTVPEIKPLECDAPNQKVSTCTTCFMTFMTPRELRRHRRNVHTKKKFACTTCDKAFKTPCEVKKHMLVHTTGRQYRCDLCDSSFKHEPNLKTHRKLHEDVEKIYKCPTCGKEYNHLSKITFRAHLRSHSRPKFIICDVCKKEISSGYYNRHKLSHGKDFKFSCDLCGKGFYFSSELKRHTERQHNKRKFLCYICGKALTGNFGLRKHLAIHRGEKPFKCTYCDKRFSNKAILKIHLRVHTKEKPIACKFCDKKFSQPTPLKLHVMTIHTKELPFACHICSKRFPMRSLLNTHLKNHPKVKATS